MFALLVARFVARWFSEQERKNEIQKEVPTWKVKSAFQRNTRHWAVITAAAAEAVGYGQRKEAGGVCKASMHYGIRVAFLRREKEAVLFLQKRVRGKSIEDNGE